MVATMPVLPTRVRFTPWATADIRTNSGLGSVVLTAALFFELGPAIHELLGLSSL